MAEPFLPSILSHAPHLPSLPDSAYPASRKTAYLPTNINVGYINPAADKLVHETVIDAGKRLRAVATAAGQDIEKGASSYPNYAAYGTQPDEIWGSNLPLLRKFKKVYDPSNVMGLAGGFKI